MDEVLCKVNGLPDIVDTVKYQRGQALESYIQKALLGAINRRLDAEGENSSTKKQFETATVQINLIQTDTIFLQDVQDKKDTKNILLILNIL